MKNLWKITQKVKLDQKLKMTNTVGTTQLEPKYTKKSQEREEMINSDNSKDVF